MNVIHKPIRTLSGVTPITILTKPYPCPGKCAFCPTEIDMPKSYLSKEPAAARAKLSQFHPRIQIEYRLQQYRQNNHPTDKIELIILGGTWSFYPKSYQTWFIKTCYDAFNRKEARTLKEAQSLNESVKHRVIGLTIETRPDFISPVEIKRLRQLGVTRVELGVQTVYADILRKNQRGHSLTQTINATRMLKEAGFKVNYHMMPNLPGSNKKRDIKMFDILFKNPDLQPDMLKIYPCILLENTLTYKWYQQGLYEPYTKTELLDLAVEIKKRVPPYVRIMRFYRDIPKEYIQGGSTTSNIRELIAETMKKRNLKCQCIRCREIKDQQRFKKLDLRITNYKASQGTELFLEYIDKNGRIYGFLRLRINNSRSCLAFKSLGDSALIRELHVYGQSTPLNAKGKVQHRGLGSKLLRKAEEITKKYGFKRIAVISGAGVRDYYRKFGSILEDTYMVKRLNSK